MAAWPRSSRFAPPRGGRGPKPGTTLQIGGVTRLAKVSPSLQLIGLSGGALVALDRRALGIPLSEGEPEAWLSSDVNLTSYVEMGSARVATDAKGRLWVAREGKATSVQAHEGAAYAARRGEALVTGGADGTLTLWRIDPEPEVLAEGAVTAPEGPPPRIEGLAVAPDGRIFVAVEGRNPEVWVFTVAD